jgi:hypothetical protein
MAAVLTLFMLHFFDIYIFNVQFEILNTEYLYFYNLFK